MRQQASTTAAEPKISWQSFGFDPFPCPAVLRLHEAVAIIAEDLRAGWKQRRTPLANGVGLIAATAKGKELILITRNGRHFAPVTGMKIENRLEAPSPPFPPADGQLGYRQL
jgi:hypothetical protein